MPAIINDRSYNALKLDFIVGNISGFGGRMLAPATQAGLPGSIPG